MEVAIDRARCNGCGFCMDVYPALFRLGIRYADYIGPNPPTPDIIPTLQGAVLLCPAIAISLKNFCCPLQ